MYVLKYDFSFLGLRNIGPILLPVLLFINVVLNLNKSPLVGAEMKYWMKFHNPFPSIAQIAPAPSTFEALTNALKLWETCVRFSHLCE